MLAKYKGKFIAGTITLFYKDTAYFWDAGWHRDYGSLAPNDLLHWQVIKWANQNRYKYYDLLRLEADRLPGIARWKMKFGGDVMPCYYLSKATPGYRLRRGLKTITNPRRVLSKLRSFMVGRSVTKHEENRG